MLLIQSFLTNIITIITTSLGWVAENDSILISPFVFWLIGNVIAMFRLLLLASYKRGFYD